LSSSSVPPNQYLHLNQFETGAYLFPNRGVAVTDEANVGACDFEFVRRGDEKGRRDGPGPLMGHLHQREESFEGALRGQADGEAVRQLDVPDAGRRPIEHAVKPLAIPPTQLQFHTQVTRVGGERWEERGWRRRDARRRRLGRTRRLHRGVAALGRTLQQTHRQQHVAARQQRHAHNAQTPEAAAVQPRAPPSGHRPPPEKHKNPKIMN